MIVNTCLKLKTLVYNIECIHFGVLRVSGVCYDRIGTS